MASHSWIAAAVELVLGLNLLRCKWFERTVRTVPAEAFGEHFPLRKDLAAEIEAPIDRSSKTNLLSHS